MQNWHWLAIGAVLGYAFAKTGGSTNAGFSFSAGVGATGARGALADGAGMSPLGEPTGSAPYQQIGVWDAQLPGAVVPQYVGANGAVDTVNGGGVM
jgi:hypothetical protein